MERTCVPLECWLIVSAHLAPCDVVKLRGVCRAFDRWVRGDALWRGVCQSRCVGLAPLPRGGWYALAASLRVHRYPLRGWGGAPLSPRGEWVSIARWSGGLLKDIKSDDGRGSSALKALMDAQAPPTASDACRPTNSLVVVPVGLTITEAQSVVAVIEGRTGVMLSADAAAALCATQVEPTLSTLDIVTCHDGVTAEIFWALLPGNSHSPSAAALLCAAWHAASRIVILARDNNALIEWTSRVGEHFPLFSDAGSFVTSGTCPDIEISMAHGKVEISSWLSNVPTELRSWVAGASNDIRASPWWTITSAKPYRVPGWIAPWVTHTPSPSTIVRIALGSVLGEGYWGISAVKHAAEIHYQRACAFYKAAMEEVFEEHLQLHPGMPMDTCALAERHAEYFHVALRNFAAATVSLTNGSDLHRSLLDVVALEIGAAFRNIWRRNNSISKKWCAAAFSAAFNDVHNACATIRSSFGAVQWGVSAFMAVRRYKATAKGLRVTDILVEELRNTTIPLFERATDHLMSSVCREISSRLSGLCDDALSEAARDTGTSGVQRAFTAHASTVYMEWAASSSISAANTLKSIEEEANSFDVGRKHSVSGTAVSSGILRRSVIEQHESRGAQQLFTLKQLLAAVPVATRKRLAVVPH